MAKPKPPTSLYARTNHTSLSKTLDTKILTLVRRYVDEKSFQQQSSTTTTSSSGSSSVRLTVSALYQYILADGSLPRQKKQNVERSIEKAIDVLLKDEGGEEDSEGAESLDSEFEGVDFEGLMDPKETNKVNKRITDMWAVNRNTNVAAAVVTPASSNVSTPGAAIATATTTTSIPVSPVTPEVAGGMPVVEPAAPAIAPTPRKRKDKRADREESSKRQKVTDKESREPPKNISLKDLGGVEDVINDLLELIGMPLTHPEVYLHTGVQPPRGVLLHGPPGCGKTMLANAIAGEIGLPFISVSAPSIVSGMSGESEKKLRDLFEEAREKAPCLIFMDEIDAITPKRESAQREMERRIVAQMLTCMDDLTLEKTDGKPVMVIGATNRPNSLDPALRRAGRFDREICLNVPDEVAREKILKVLSNKLRLSGDFDFKALAKMTPGFVGADLNALTAAAGVAAIKRIFETLKTGPDSSSGVLEAISESSSGAMELDDQPSSITPILDTEISQQLTITNDPVPKTSIIQQFMKNYPSTLTPAQLEPLSITINDFLTALPKIQPSSKREGFTTVPDVTWQDIGALQSIRVEMQMAIVQPIRRPELYESVGITSPTGVLLWGPPGCGKTLLAKAVANESRANFISVRGPELLNKYVGESERAVRQVFARARASVPCVIFFDELDALVPRRDDSLSESSARVVNTLLTELDGLNDRKGIYVIGATNRPDVIDPAMLRPGRLDKPLLVDLPTPPERVDILGTLTKKSPLHADVDLRVIGQDERCGNFSGADLAALVREASVAALRGAFFKGVDEMEVESTTPAPAAVKVQEKVWITKSDFETAFGNVRPSVTDYDRRQYRELATRFGWGKTNTIAK